MPEALIMFIIEQPNDVLLELLGWLRADPEHAIMEFEAVITRQGIPGAEGV